MVSVKDVELWARLWFAPIVAVRVNRKVSFIPAGAR